MGLREQLARAGVDPCPRFGEREPEIVTPVTVTKSSAPKPVTVTETRNADEKLVTRKGKRGPAATHTSPAEKQRAYRERKKVAASS